MKKIYSFLTLMVAAAMCSFSANAQTDVTATYLLNPGFDEAPICYTVSGGTVLNAEVTRIGTTGWIFPIPGWNQESVINANAVQVATGEYGTVANAQGFNNVAVPATDKNGSAVGAAISMSAGWGDKAMLSQNVILPSGKYVLKYDIINQHTALNVNANLTGFIPGDGSAAIYGTRKNYPQGTWVTDSVGFFLTAETAGKINLGYTTSSNGSANGCKFFIDNVKLYYYGIDKSTLKHLVDSANVMKANPQDVGESTVYTSLATAITSAQATIDKLTASAAEVVGAETSIKAAIDAVHGAILLQTRVKTWTNIPYNATEAIANPGFEQGFTGWLNEGPFYIQTNTSFDPKKVGTNYAERWVAGPGTLANLKISQEIRNIPNGVYLLTASAHATQQADNTYPGGAFLVANEGIKEIFTRDDYSVTANVVDNTLTISIEVMQTGNWVAFDNFRLSYISNGSPYVVAAPEAIQLTPSSKTATITVTGGNLTGPVTVSASPAFSLSKTSLTAAEVSADGGTQIDVTYNGTTNIAKDSIVFTHGDAKDVVYVSAKETLTIAKGGLFYDQSTPFEVMVNIKGDLFSGLNIEVPAGIETSATSLIKEDLVAGADISFIWDQSTYVNDKYIKFSTGSTKDSILVFATANNIISTWDGDNAEGEGSALTNFGWSLTEKDGVTPVAATFNLYNVTGGIRYVPVTTQNYTYKGRPWSGIRLAYLRTFGDSAKNVFNLNVNLEAGKKYTFRGVGCWHDNETNPTFKYAVNSAMANTGDTLGIQAQAFTVKRQAADYRFSFTAKNTATHYFTVSSTVKGDVMNAPLYLAIYEDNTTAVKQTTASTLKAYPTMTSGLVNISTGGKEGTVSVYDIAGKLVSSKNLNGSSAYVQLPAQGIYFLKINADNESKTVKVICVK